MSCGGEELDGGNSKGPFENMGATGKLKIKSPIVNFLLRCHCSMPFLFIFISKICHNFFFFFWIQGNLIF
jgi:hypothetical protein